MKTVFTDEHRHQDGQAELIGGKLLPCFEMPRRAEYVLNRVRAVKLGRVLRPSAFGRKPLTRVHAPDFVDFLETAWDQWIMAHGAYDGLPISWVAPGMRRIVPERIDGKMGYYSFDAGTPITAGTWRAAKAAADVALTGEKLIEKGERAVFALCRPPGHHAGRGFYGGYCFLNNAAIAAQAFRDGGARRVAVLDVDYHHGNGTQEIFYRRSDVLFVSLHGHPAQEYPYFVGYADEKGEGRGEGFNLNLPMRWGTAWDAYGDALDAGLARIRRYRPDAVVVSLGVDTFKADPISHFKLESEDYLTIGASIARLGRPTLFVMEGGYAVDELGINAVNVLQGFEEVA